MPGKAQKHQQPVDDCRYQPVAAKRYKAEALPPWLWNAPALSPGIVGLHEEILQFQRWISPRPCEVAARDRLVRRLRGIVRRQWPQARLEVFGSYSTGLYLPTSDMDVVIFGKWSALPLRALERLLRESRCATDIKVLEKATVPIVKMRDADSGISVDISFNMPNGVRSAALIRQFIQRFPCLKPLVLVLKQFLLQRDLNEVWTGGISSYALTLMVVSFLQLHHRRSQLLAPVDQLNLGTLLIEFFELYGRQFNYMTTGIRVSDGGAYVPKDELLRSIGDQGHRPSILCIEDPLTPGNDIGRSSYGVLQVKRAFNFAFVALCRSMLPIGDCCRMPSVLSSIVSADVRLLQYRQWLQNVFGNAASDESDQSDFNE